MPVSSTVLFVIYAIKPDLSLEIFYLFLSFTSMFLHMWGLDDNNIEEIIYFIGKNASLHSKEQIAVSSQVLHQVQSAAVFVSAAANLIYQPSTSVSQVNLANITTTNRTHSENGW